MWLWHALMSMVFQLSCVVVIRLSVPVSLSVFVAVLWLEEFFKRFVCCLFVIVACLMLQATQSRCSFELHWYPQCMLPVFRSTCGNIIHYADTLICNRFYYIVMPKRHMQIYSKPASCQLLNYLMNGRNDAHTNTHMYIQRLYSLVARLPIGCAIFASIRFEMPTHSRVAKS